MSLLTTILKMDALSLTVIASLLAFVAAVLVVYTTDKPWRRRSAIPEASGARPLIGHLHLLATQPYAHRFLGDMADQYGPIFTIKLGARRAIIVSSWEWVKEFLGTNNDKNFLTRPSSATSKYMGYGRAMFSISAYGPYWRNMRRISTQELLSKARFDHLGPVRSSELNTCLKHLFSLCQEDRTGSAKVDMSEWFTSLSMNVMLLMIVGKRYEHNDESGEDSRRFVKTVREFMKLVGVFVMSDFIPFIEWMDLQGHIKGMKRVAKELDCFITRLLEDRVRNEKEGKVKEHERDFMDVMLETFTEQYDSSLLEDHSIENVVKSTFLILLLAGMDATSITLTWALSLLLNHNEVLKKARSELDIHVGRDRWVEESDINNLEYIVAIVKETLRLYPPIPLNLPHEAIEDCYVAGHHIPKGTLLLVNIWKVHRDPLVWSDPDKFQPNRFLISNSKFDEKGNTSKYIPFGAGRRSCPAISPAMQMSCLALARVLQGFNFETLRDKNIDMREDIGITMPRATPLEVALTPRLPNELYQYLKCKT